MVPLCRRHPCHPRDHRCRIPEDRAGRASSGAIEFTIEYVESGKFDDVPNTIHGKAFHLLRLLVANHPFVDGNKRTALNTVVVFYFLNGYRFSYDDGIRDLLKRIASDEADVERQMVLDYLRAHAENIALEDAVDEWREELLAYGLDRLSEERSDPND